MIPPKHSNRRRLLAVAGIAAVLLTGCSGLLGAGQREQARDRQLQQLAVAVR